MADDPQVNAASLRTLAFLKSEFSHDFEAGQETGFESGWLGPNLRNSPKRAVYFPLPGVYARDRAFVQAEGREVRALAALLRRIGLRSLVAAMSTEKALRKFDRSPAAFFADMIGKRLRN